MFLIPFMKRMMAAKRLLQQERQKRLKWQAEGQRRLRPI